MRELKESEIEQVAGGTLPGLVITNHKAVNGYTGNRFGDYWSSTSSGLYGNPRVSGLKGIVTSSGAVVSDIGDFEKVLEK